MVIWSVVEGRALHVLDHLDPVEFLEAAPCGAAIVTVGWHAITMWDAGAGWEPAGVGLGGGSALESSIGVGGEGERAEVRRGVRLEFRPDMGAPGSDSGDMCGLWR